MFVNYESRPKVIKAMLWDGSVESTKEIVRYSEGKVIHKAQRHLDGHNNLYIATLEGEMEASIGDYIIQGLEGEFYPCKPDIFHKSYALVTEQKRLTGFENMEWNL